MLMEQQDGVPRSGFQQTESAFGETDKQQSPLRALQTPPFELLPVSVKASAPSEQASDQPLQLFGQNTDNVSVVMPVATRSLSVIEIHTDRPNVDPHFAKRAVAESVVLSLPEKRVAHVAATFLADVECPLLVDISGMPDRWFGVEDNSTACCLLSAANQISCGKHSGSWSQLLNFSIFVREPGAGSTCHTWFCLCEYLPGCLEDLVFSIHETKAEAGEMIKVLGDCL